jgi:putative flippase GtrA
LSDPGSPGPRSLDRRPVGLLSAQFLRFGLVGVVGFLVDAGLLRLLLHYGLGYYGGRVISFLAAATTTWILNRSFTFRRDAPSAFAHPATEWLSYLGLMLIGGAANYGAYALAIATSETVRAHPELGVALGSLAGMVINFWTSKRMIFERPERGP